MEGHQCALSIPGKKLQCSKMAEGNSFIFDITTGGKEEVMSLSYSRGLSRMDGTVNQFIRREHHNGRSGRRRVASNGRTEEICAREKARAGKEENQ